MTGSDDHKHAAARPARAGHAAHGHGRKRAAHHVRHAAHRIPLAILHHLNSLRHLIVRALRHRWVKRTLWTSAVSLVVVVVGMLGLWWRLSNGPIELDMATPWLKAAIEENFGGKHTVTVGGTQLERDENGGTSLRLRNIVVRDSDGTIVASAPKAEVGLSGLGLLKGQLRAQSLNLVGAEMSVRIEADGRVTVFAGADKRPIATAAPAPVAPPVSKPDQGTVPPGPLRSGFQDLAGLLAWIDGLGATGLDGHDLRELGLKNGNLIVDDRRSGKRWTFDRINASLRRPRQGGVVFRLESENPQRPWLLSAAMRPLSDGVRAIGLEARQVSFRDIMLALRIDTGDFDVDLPLSASIRGEIAADGMPQLVQGQLLTGGGSITDHEPDDTTVTVPIDRADFRFSWDVRHRVLLVPFQVKSGGNQFTLRAAVQAPVGDGGQWEITVTRGDQVIDPIILSSSGSSSEESFALNHVAMHLRLDTVRKRIDLDQGDLARVDTRPTHNVAVAVTGSLDYAKTDPHLAFGVAGTRMPVSVLKRLWPVFSAVPVRQWVEEHVSGGTVERVVVAGNAPISCFKPGGPPTPEDGLSVDIETSGTSLRPVENLPEIHDADLTVRITGGTATINLGRGTLDVGPGRKLNIANGQFDMPDTHPKPAPANVRFRVDGSVPSVAALLSSDALRDQLGAISLDQATSRGTVAAQIFVNLPIGKNVPKGSVNYAVTADLASFAADKMLMGEKLEAGLLQVNADGRGYQIKGEVKINGTPANIVLTKQKQNADADVQLTAVLDEAARKRLGINFGSAVTGAIPVKITGKMGDSNKDDPLTLDADLTSIAVDELLPGWVKPAGKSARLVATVTKGPKSVRFDDLAITSPGVSVKGSVEVDNSGELISANFPVFALSDGDKVSVKADRGNDGALHVVMRGDVFDGRNFVKSSLAGHTVEKKHKQADLDLDVKLGIVAGHNGETLRGVDLKLARRNGHIRSFTLAAKIGRDAPLIGDLRLRSRDNHQVLFLETDDAGALFRFTDMYPRMYGGKMWVAMDPPTQDQAPQVGHLYISNFVVRGEQALQRVINDAPGGQRNAVEFTELHSDFTRFPGRMAVRDGVVRGPLVGATIEGQIDYVRDDVHLRGTFVPFYGLNNMFGQIPIVGMFLGGGSNEGLVGITYEAVGPPGAPRITVNPVTAIAPGLLRKFVPSPGSFDQNFVPPQQ